MERIGVIEDTADTDTASTSELTALDSNEEGSNLSNKKEKTEEN